MKESPKTLIFFSFLRMFFQKGIDKRTIIRYNVDMRILQAAVRIEHTEMYSRGRRGAPAKGVGRDNRRESSNLSISAKKEVTFVYQKLLLFLSKPQAWHIIDARSAAYIIKDGAPSLYLITRQRAFSAA